MKKFTLAVFIVVLALLTQSCATTKSKKMAKNKLKIPRQNQSYALMDEDSSTDFEIIRRGNKTRGTEEY